MWVWAGYFSQKLKGTKMKFPSTAVWPQGCWLRYIFYWKSSVVFDHKWFDNKYILNVTFSNTSIFTCATSYFIPAPLLFPTLFSPPLLRASDCTGRNLIKWILHAKNGNMATARLLSVKASSKQRCPRSTDNFLFRASENEHRSCAKPLVNSCG